MLSVARAAEERPGHPALISSAGVLSYRALADQVLPRSRWLRAQGVSRLAVVARRDLEAVLMMLAAIEVGIPLVLLHARWTSQERGRALEQAGDVLLVDEDFRFAGWSETDPSSSVVGAEAIDPESCLAVVFTSGSTGRPRGVVLSRRAFVAAAEASAAQLGWQDQDRWLVSLPLAHVGGFAILVRTLLSRSTAVLASAGSCSAAQLVDAVQAHKVTLMSLVPASVVRLLEHEPSWQPSASLRAILVGGAACPTALSERALARGWPILQTYGMTETCGQVATRRPGSSALNSASSGQVLPGVQVEIVEGEVLVGGPTLCSGILGQDQGPLDAAGRFHTGDLGHLSESAELTVLGRADARINSGGEKVHPHEVEEAIVSFPGVAQACVVGLGDPRWGEVVAAAVEPVPSAALELDALKAYLQERLSPWKRPKRLEVLAALPQTPSGKIDRLAVLRLLATEVS